MSQLNYLEEISNECQRLGTLTEITLANEIQEALNQVLAGKNKEKGIVNVLAVAALQLFDHETTDEEVHTDSIIYGAFFSQMILHCWRLNKDRLRAAHTHEAPNATQ
jgi:hypothetical protein